MRHKKYSTGKALFLGLFLFALYLALHDSFLLARIPHHLGLVIINLIPLLLLYKLLSFTWKFMKDLAEDIFK